MGTAKRERQRLNRQLGRELQARDDRRSTRKRRALQIGIGLPVLVAAAIGLIFIVQGGDDDEETPAASTVVTTSTVAGSAITGETTCPPVEGSAERVGSFEQAPPQCIDPTKAYTAEVTTDHGSFTIELATSESPINVNNFVVLSRYRYYEGTSCHRIISEFVVQCGRPGADEEAPGYTVSDELPAAGSYAEGVVAVANTGAEDTGGGQFFIVTGDDGAALPPQYTVLGRVVEGYDTTVAALEALADPAAANGVPPLEPVTITGVTITESDEPVGQPTTTPASAESSTSSSPS